MKKRLFLGILLSIAMLFTACAAVETPDSGASEETVPGEKDNDVRLNRTEISMATLCEAEPGIGKCESVVVFRNGVFRTFANGNKSYIEYYETKEPIADMTLQAPVAVKWGVRNQINEYDVMILATRISGATSAEQGKTGGLYCYAYRPEQNRGIYEFIPGTGYPDHDTLAAKETDTCIAGLCNVLWAARGTGKQLYGMQNPS